MACRSISALRISSSVSGGQAAPARLFPQARALIAAHGPSLNMTLRLQTLRPPDRRADTDPEPVRGFPGRRAA
jgi:hypothetical protein